jgi:hypothetical protein
MIKNAEACAAIDEIAAQVSQKFHIAAMDC